jgi:5,10-methylenetetrahydrofolate reductase
MVRPLAEALQKRPLFFEPVPPIARSSPARIDTVLLELSALLLRSPRVDAVDVPELVDENHDGRPYFRSVDPRGFGRRVAERAGIHGIVNKVVAHLENAAAVERWARETAERGIVSAVLVGGSSRYIPYPGPPVAEANRICRPIFTEVGGCVGNIAIPSRMGEPHRMLAKTRAGARFFTTQIVFDDAATVRTIREYDLLCRQAGLEPATVLVSFAPLADEIDAEFVRWLGGEIPESAERAILNGEDGGAGTRSVAHSLAVWRRILARLEEAGCATSVGVNVEQISQRHLSTAAEMLAAFTKGIDENGAPSTP